MTKRKLISLCFNGTETVEHFAKAVIEVPPDATQEEINALCGEDLQSYISERSKHIEWEVEDSTGIEALSVTAEGEVEESEPDLRLIRDEDGALVPIPEHIEDQLVD